MKRLIMILALDVLFLSSTSPVLANEPSKPLGIYNHAGDQALTPFLFMSDEAVNNFFSPEAARLIAALKPYAVKEVNSRGVLLKDGSIKPGSMSGTMFGMLWEAKRPLVATLQNFGLSPPFHYEATTKGNKIIVEVVK